MLLLFLSGKKNSSLQVTKLSMSNGNGPANQKKSLDLQSEKLAELKQQNVRSEKITQVLEPEVNSNKSKMLNVIFQYNGHSWDAYEVLGVPAGSSLPVVTEAFQKSIKNSDPSSAEFFQTAYQCILSRY